MKTIHDIITKVFATEFWLWHYTVLLYDNESYELYEMSRPMDRNGICINLDYWAVYNKKFISALYWANRNNLFDKDEISNDELMLPDNEDIRRAIKIKQENFYITD